jgi:hypothetical protein
MIAKKLLSRISSLLKEALLESNNRNEMENSFIKWRMDLSY